MDAKFYEELTKRFIESESSLEEFLQKEDGPQISGSIGPVPENPSGKMIGDREGYHKKKAEE